MSDKNGPVLPFPMAVVDVSVEVTLPRVETLRQLEALLFSAGDPVSEGELARALEREDLAEIRQCLFLFQVELETSERGLDLLRVGARWQLRTRPEHKEIVLRLLGARPKKLSRAALETLSIIAYEQPVTRMEVDEIRGVESGGVVKSLLNRELVRVVGRRAVPGRPLEYGTTRGFLEIFGLSDLKALPTLREYQELALDNGDD